MTGRGPAQAASLSLTRSDGRRGVTMTTRSPIPSTIAAISLAASFRRGTDTQALEQIGDILGVPSRPEHAECRPTSRTWRRREAQPGCPLEQHVEVPLKW